MSDVSVIEVDLQELDGIYFLVESGSGVVYSHQCGGLATYDLSEEGFLFPCPRSAEASKELYSYFYLGPKYKGNCYDGIDEVDATFIDSLLESLGYGMLSVDRELFSKSFEAWVYLKLESDCPCFPYCYNSNPTSRIVMIWENSD